MMDNTKLAYFAGFFDGEGSIGIGQHKSKSCLRGHSNELMVQVSNIWKSVIEEHKRIFGGSIVPVRDSDRTIILWRWTVGAKKAHRFLMAIYPYLDVKRSQAQIAIDFQQNKRHRGSLSNIEYAKEKEQREAIQNLNRKGLCSKVKLERKNNLKVTKGLRQEYPK